MARVPQHEDNALTYALEDYSEMTMMLLSSSTEWTAGMPKITRCRSTVVRQILRIRHKLDIPHKLLQTRMQYKEVLAKKARRRTTKPSTSSRKVRTEYGRLIENFQGPAAQQSSQGPSKVPRPCLALRQIGDIEETFHLRYRIQCVDTNTSALKSTLLSRGKLVLADDLLPQLFEVEPIGNTLQDLVLSLTTPWTFLPQSSVRISDASKSNVLSSTIPTEVKGRDDKKRTLCTLGTLLAPVTSPCPSKACHVVVDLKLSDDSFFMNSVLATGIPCVAPVKKVRLVFELAGFDFKGLPEPSHANPPAAANLNEGAPGATKRKRGRPPKSKAIHALEPYHEDLSRSPSPNSFIPFSMEGPQGNSEPLPPSTFTDQGQQWSTLDSLDTSLSIHASNPHMRQGSSSNLPLAIVDLNSTTGGLGSFTSLCHASPFQGTIAFASFTGTPSLADIATCTTHHPTHPTSLFDFSLSSTATSLVENEPFALPSSSSSFVEAETSSSLSSLHLSLPYQSPTPEPTNPYFAQTYGPLDSSSYLNPLWLHQHTSGGWGGNREGPSFASHPLPHPLRDDNDEGEGLAPLLDHPWGHF